jgi:hypothetical protein
MQFALPCSANRIRTPAIVSHITQLAGKMAGEVTLISRRDLKQLLQSSAF